MCCARDRGRVRLKSAAARLRAPSICRESEHFMFGTMKKPAVLCILASLLVSSISFAPAPVSALSDARTGCMNQWLFNGIWRVRVTKVEPLMNGSQQAGWQVTQTWRNGTATPIAPSDSMMKDEQLVTSAQTLAAEEHRQQGLSY